MELPKPNKCFHPNAPSILDLLIITLIIHNNDVMFQAMNMTKKFKIFC